VFFASDHFTACEDGDFYINKELGYIYIIKIFIIFFYILIL